MKNHSSLKKEKQPKVTLFEKWKFRKALKFVSRSDSPAKEEVLLALCREIGSKLTNKLLKWRNISMKSIFKKKINDTDSVIETEALLMILNILLSKSMAFEDNESIDKLEALRHQVYYDEFDFDITMRELKRIGDYLKKYD